MSSSSNMAYNSDTFLLMRSGPMEDINEETIYFTNQGKVMASNLYEQVPHGHYVGVHGDLLPTWHGLHLPCKG
jgi:hypothetical protein